MTNNVYNEQTGAQITYENYKKGLLTEKDGIVIKAVGAQIDTILDNIKQQYPYVQCVEVINSDKSIDMINEFLGNVKDTMQTPMNELIKEQEIVKKNRFKKSENTIKK